jgi:hypothetical protein
MKALHCAHNKYSAGRTFALATKALMFTAILAVVALSTAEAQHRAGYNGGAFLKIGVGAREVGLGSAVTSMANDANQVFWNPAGAALRGDQQVSVALSHNSWIAGLDYNSMALGYRIGNAGTITAGVQVFGISDIPANRQTGYADPILQDLVTDQMTTASYSYQDLALSLSYANYVIDRLSLGATAKFIRQGIDDQAASAVAFDFGSVYHVGYAGLQIAARLNNLGSSLQFFNQQNALPLTFSIGASVYPINTEQMRLMVAVDATKPQDADQLIFGGAEVSFYDLLFLRGGRKFNYGQIGTGVPENGRVAETVEGFSLGGGLQYPVANIALAVDYAFTQMNLFSNTHQITLRIGM